MSESQIKNETKKEIEQSMNEDQQEYNKKSIYENENTKKQESRMMNFFNQEFVERKIDFKPK